MGNSVILGMDALYSYNFPKGTGDYEVLSLSLYNCHIEVVPKYLLIDLQGVYAANPL